MQKIAFSQIVREELLRASIFAVSFFVRVTLGFVGMAYAATDGWIFGNILNLILVKSWDDPTNDGTVRNANNLGWDPATAFAQLTANRSCEAPQCIYGFQANGDVMCR